MGRPLKNQMRLPPALKIQNDATLTSHKIIKYLTDNFLSGQLDSGARLPSERQLSELLGVTRSVVRDAIKSLEVLGVIEVRHGDGAYLCEDTKSLFPATIEWGLFLRQPRVLDLVEAREHLEISLAGLAAKRRTEEQLKTMAEAIDQMSKKKISHKLFVEADITFHFAIAEASGNTALRDLLANITALLRVWMSRSIKAAGETQTSLAEHVKVYEAIQAKNPVKARAAMSSHMDAAETRLKMTLDVPPDNLPKMFPHQESTSTGRPKI